MNESSMFEIPIGLLAFMDGEINNPERYQYKVLEEVEASAISYANRVNYLQVTHCMIVRMTTTAWYTQNQLADSLHFNFYVSSSIISNSPTYFINLLTNILSFAFLLIYRPWQSLLKKY